MMRYYDRYRMEKIIRQGMRFREDVPSKEGRRDVMAFLSWIQGIPDSDAELIRYMLVLPKDCPEYVSFAKFTNMESADRRLAEILDGLRHYIEAKRTNRKDGADHE